MIFAIKIALVLSTTINYLIFSFKSNVFFFNLLPTIFFNYQLYFCLSNNIHEYTGFMSWYSIFTHTHTHTHISIYVHVYIHFYMCLPYIHMGFPGKSVVKNPPANVGDVGLIPGLGRSPGEGNGNPLQYSHLGNAMNRQSWRATVHGGRKSRTHLGD